MNQDKTHMAAALDLGRRMLGQTAPNPAVGCVIVKDGKVIGRGTTQSGGRPHAETEALRQAGEAARGATVYVSLEPCAHEGKTGSCAQALIKMGVARVVSPIEDPDARVAGKGFHMLREAGIKVETGVLANEAEQIHEGFLKRVRFGRPMFTFKIAASMDGRIATRHNESKWISGEMARAHAHLLRARHDAIMIGIGTALADDPLLTCRLPGMENQSPIRIVMDRKLQLPMSSQLVRTVNAAPLWIVTSDRHSPDRLESYEKAGVKIVPVPANDDGYSDPNVTARKLGELGLTRVLIEGGAQLASAFFKEDLIDRIDWITAPILLGGDGLPAVQGLDRAALADHQRFKSLNARKLGNDRLESYVRAR